MAPVSTVGRVAEALTEPIPVTRVSATGELLPGGVDQGRPVPEGMPVTAAVQAPDQAAAPGPVEQVPVREAPVEQAPAEQAPAEQAPAEQAPAEQAPAEQAPAEQAPAEQAPAEQAPAEQAPAEQGPAEQAPVEQAPVEQAPVEQGPAEQAPAEQGQVEQAPAEQAHAEQRPAEHRPVTRVGVPPITPEMPLGRSRRSLSKAGLRARVARGMAAASRPPAGLEVPERQDAGQSASRPAQEDAAAPGTAAALDAPAAPEAPARRETATAADQAAAEQAAADQAAAEQAAADQAAAEQAAADQVAADRAAAEQQAAAQRAAERKAQQAAARRALDEAIVQRTAAALARKSPPAQTLRRVGLAAAVLALVAGAAAVGFSSLGSGGHHSHRLGSGSVPTAVVNRDHAAAWVASQVSPTTMVSCDPATCVLIESHGFPASHVRVLGPGKGNPLVSNVVVATPAVRRQFGAQLTSVYAPGLLATFGSGSRQVDIQLVAPHGAVAYHAALNADLQNRQQSGAGLSGSNRIQAPSTAQKQLGAGQVDSRLMITLALMASLHPVHLVAFGDGGPNLDSAPLRSAELIVTGSAQKQVVLTFLRQQQPPYRPAHVMARPMGRGRTMLTMEFTAPSPVGLFH